MRVRLRALVTVACACLITTAAACSSVPDVIFSDDASASSSGGVDAGIDGAIIDPNCKPTGAEICDDGIDNDCNGVADCADPACSAGYACIDPVPDGWSYVAFAGNTTTACPAGFGASTDLKTVTGDGSGGTCSCSCNATGTGCTSSAYALKTGTGVCDTTTGSILSNSAACQAFSTPPDLATGAFAQVVAPAAGGSCNKAVTKGSSVPAIKDGRQCAAPPRGGKGCPGTQVCVPKPATMQLCAMKPSVDACPAAFSVKRTAGTGATDQRVCNDASCTCTGPTCTGPLSLFSNANCMGGKSTTIAAGGACQSPPGGDFGMNGSAKGYTSTIAGACSTAGGFNNAVSGSIAFANQETICCKQ
jgi:hypothetical protein